MYPFFVIGKAHAQPKDAPYIWAYLLLRLETLPEIKVSEKIHGVNGCTLI